MAPVRLRLLVPVAAAMGCAALALLPATSNASPSGGSAASSTTRPARFTAGPAHRAVGFGSGRIGDTADAPAAAGQHPFNVNGYNWSGVVVTGSGFTSVSASWTEPSVTCTSTNDEMAIWVGLDGYGSSTVEQVGVATDCSSGHPAYQGFYEMYPAAPVYYSNPVSGGDQITASVTRSGTSYTLKLSDATKGWTKTTTKSMSASNSSAEVIVESSTASFPKFGDINFSSVTINGNPVGTYNPVLLDASNSYGYEDHTSPVSGSKFSVAYLRE